MIKDKKEQMKHQIIRILVGVGLLTGSIAWATNRTATQKVELENIVSPTKVEYDSVWYARQAEGWAKEIKKNPKSVKQDSATYKMLTNLAILLIMAYICHLKQKNIQTFCR